MILSLVFLLMVLLAIVFVLWRVKFPLQPEQITEDDLALNRSLFREKLAQLQDQLTCGDINQQQYHALELEYQRQFLADNPENNSRTSGSRGRGPVIFLALLIPVLAISLYYYLGAAAELNLRSQLEQRAALFSSGQGESAEMKMATYQVIETLTGLTRKDPENPMYPVLLARLYSDEGAFQMAIPQYLKATALLPEDGLLLAEYAQVLFFAGGNQMTDKISQLALTALQLTPVNQTALSLAGIASFNNSDYQGAIDYWNRAAHMLPPGSPSRSALESGLAAARERLGTDTEVAGIVAGVTLTLQVSIDKALEVPEDATVFVYARTWQGSPMPLAIKKMRVSDLPAEVLLTDAMAMTPAMSLATVDQVEVIARVSLTGSPTPAAGDYQASAGPVEVKTQQKPVALSINTRIQ